MAKNQRLQELFHRWIQGITDASEDLELGQMLEDINNEPLFEAMRKEWDELQELEEFNETQQQKIIARALGHDVAVIKTVHRVHFLRKWRWAAAVLLFLGIGAYLFNITIKKKDSVAQNGHATKVEVIPGSNKAILTLSNGTLITLDSTVNGTIARQGSSSIVKSGNGEIRYDLNGSSQNEVMINTMSTPRGGQYKLVLPDGTRVWLNAASSITYPAVFIGSDRKIKITGEVYMEVAANKAKPFFVDIDGKSTVQVLGTSFNINSYTDEGVIKTTLVEGSIRINKDDQNLVLKPGQQAVSELPASQAVKKIIKIVNTPNIEQVLAWKNGYFNFDNIGLREMARQIERWYDIQVVFDDKFTDMELKGKMDRGVKLADIIRFFNDYGFKTALEGGKLVVAKK